MLDVPPDPAPEPAFDWKHPTAAAYDAIYKQRAAKLQGLLDDARLIAPLNEFYKTHPAEWISDWGITFDPRNLEIDLPAAMPFVLFPRQVEFINWLYARWRAREDGLCEKSRDMGITWLCVGFAAWMWVFYPGSTIGFGSRKEEYVDKLDDPKSIFWKLRQFIGALPVIWRPDSYDERKHAPSMKISNPLNGAVIAGEAGDNIGRGARTSVYFKDESAYYERPDLIDNALSMTSNCKIDLSTPNGNGNPFYRKRHAGKIPVFTFHWRDDPRKDQAWYEREKEKSDNPVLIAQELDIDYNASTTDAYISGALVADAQSKLPIEVEAHGKWIVGVDAAHMGDDKSIITPRKGRVTLPATKLHGADGVLLAGRVTSLCDDLGGEGEIYAIVIELDGPGVSCYDQLRLGKYAGCVVGVHTGTKLDDGKNYNLRAKLWCAGRDYLKQPPISMPRDPDLKAQLASMRYKFKDGLLLMQDKATYKKEFGRSPDDADSWILTFAADDAGMNREKRRRERDWRTA